MRRDDRPTVAVVAVAGTTEAVRPLIRGLAHHAEVRSLGRAERPDAILATHPGATVAVVTGCPLAIVEDGQVTVRGEHGRSLGPPLALPGPEAVDTAVLAPLAPHVRRRWRERLALRPDLVIDTAALDRADVSTALAVAAAAVVDRHDLPMALALGCPTVTDQGAARSVGAEPGRDLVVGGWADAVALAEDEPRAARMSRRARGLAVKRFDPLAAAHSLLELWGLVEHADPTSRMEATLGELDTAPVAPVRRRVADALALFSSTA